MLTGEMYTKASGIYYTVMYKRTPPQEVGRCKHFENVFRIWINKANRSLPSTLTYKTTISVPQLHLAVENYNYIINK